MQAPVFEQMKDLQLDSGRVVDRRDLDEERRRSAGVIRVANGQVDEFTPVEIKRGF